MTARTDSVLFQRREESCAPACCCCCCCLWNYWHIFLSFFLSCGCIKFFPAAAAFSSDHLNPGELRDWKGTMTGRGSLLSWPCATRKKQTHAAADTHSPGTSGAIHHHIHHLFEPSSLQYPHTSGTASQPGKATVIVFLTNKASPYSLSRCVRVPILTLNRYSAATI